VGILDKLKDNEKIKIPKPIEERMKRGLDRMLEGAPKRNECYSFVRGDQFKFVNTKNTLTSQPTVSDYMGRRGKPPHRVRTVRNLIFDIVERQVSDTVQRVPSYEVHSSTSDPEDIGAARLAEKVAVYGFDKWRVRAATERVVRNAVIAGEGFAWPFFDTSIGPFFDAGKGVSLGQGDIKIRCFTPNEVYWEPGLIFEESRWHCVQQAQDLESVYELPGFTGGQLDPDANTSEIESSEHIEDAKLVMVTHYLERPCPKYPQGRWIVMANKRVICKERAYPCVDGEGEPVDEPILHKLSYAMDADSDRGMGLVPHLLDPNRAVNNAVNKTIEWAALALNPQLVILGGNLQKGQRLTDEPGQVYNANGAAVEWRQVPNMPQELFQLKEQAEADMARIAAQNDIPSNVESGKAIQALIEQDQSRKANFIANLAEFHSRLMRHCLYLVQKHYTEERLIKIRGRGFDPGSSQDFLGAELKGQVDVRVYPDSIEPQTRAGQEQKIQNIAMMFPGAFEPEVVISAMESGTTSTLIRGFELNKQRASLIMQKVRDETLMDAPNRPVFPNEDAGPALDDQGNPIPQLDETGQQMFEPGEPDPMTGMPTEPKPMYMPATEVPDWMPRPFDNTSIHKKMWEDWMQTPDWDALDEPQKEQGMLYYTALLDLESMAAQREAELQTQQAESLGMQNAAKPQQKLSPSLPALNGDGQDPNQQQQQEPS
jgi:hypothetical protein